MPGRNETLTARGLPLESVISARCRRALNPYETFSEGPMAPLLQARLSRNVMGSRTSGHRIGSFPATSGRSIAA